jgi:hypothetical protein
MEKSPVIKIRSLGWAPMVILYISGAKPTTVSYNVSAVKIYNATSSLVRFENKKNVFFYFEKRSMYFTAGVVVANYKPWGWLQV